MKKLTSSIRTTLQFLLVVVALLGSLSAVAQPISGITPAKRLQVAEEKLIQGDTYNAMQWFEKAYLDDTTSVNVLGKLAQVNTDLRDYRKAQAWYSRLLVADKENKFPEARFSYARALKMDGKYEDAAAQFQKFIDTYTGPNANLRKLAGNEILGIELGKEMRDDANVRIANAGMKVNSPYTEFGAVALDDETIVYSAIRSDSVIVIDEKTKGYFSKIYQAKRDGDNFTQGELLGGTINKDGIHAGNATASADKNTLYFTYCTMKGNAVGHCDIFASKKSGNDWAEGTKIAGGINNDAYTTKHPAIGNWNGKQGLFVASDKAGGSGGFDIYFSPMLADGSFGELQTLGEKVNTMGDEITPFFRENTLYFSSNGLPTIGGFDVFSTEIAGGEWTTPKNMGKPINSRDDDMYYAIGDNGYQGYIISNRPGTMSLKAETCCDDIFTVTYPFFNTVKLVVVDSLKAPLMGTGVVFKELDAAGKPLMAGGLVERKNNPSGNDYRFVHLPTEKRYRIVVSKEGFYPDSTEVTTSGLKKPAELFAKINLRKIPPPPPVKPVPPIVKPEPIISLHNIYYDFNKSNIRTDAARTLDTIINILKLNSGLVVEVGSHTDDKGSNAYNNILSERRSEKAIEWMTQRGIDKTRLVSTHFGEEQPVAPNELNGKDNPEGRQLNRRTEFHVLRQFNLPPAPTSVPSTTNPSAPSSEKKK